MAFWVAANDRFILTAFLYNKMINFNTVFYCMAVYQTTPTLSNIVLSILALLTNILLVYRALHVSKLLSVTVSGTLTINTDPGMANVCLYRYALQNRETT